MCINLYKKGRGVNLHYQKFIYAMNSKYKEKIYWRCVNSKCLSRISTKFDEDTNLSGSFPEHIHIKNIVYNNMLESFGFFWKLFKKKKNGQKPIICSTDSDTAVLPKEENGETWTIGVSI